MKLVETVFQVLARGLSKPFTRKKKKRRRAICRQSRRRSAQTAKKKTAPRKKTKSLRAKVKKAKRPQKKVVRKKPATKRKKATRTPTRRRLKTSTTRPKKKIKRTGSKRKLVARRPRPKPATKKKPAVDREQCIGEVTHYFSKIKVCVVRLKAGRLSVGERIRIAGATTRCTQTVSSLQIECENVSVAKKGQLVGLKVGKKVREGDEVFKILS